MTDNPRREVLQMVARVIDAPPNRTPDQWADACRVMPKGSAEPGRMRTGRTPYVIPIARAFQVPTLSRISFMMARQMAKTNGVCFNVIGQRLDDDPTPMVYVGPTQANIDDVIEPKIQEMLRNSESLWEKTAKGQGNKKHAKLVSGVQLRMGWAGSSTQLKADSAGIVLVDELDGIEAEQKGGGGEGSIIDMCEAITSTYPDGKIGLTSTMTYGNVESFTHEKTGLVHWRVSDAVTSAIWKQWQEGSRHEWAFPCPDCFEYFIPRFNLMGWPEGATAEEAERDSWVACPHCGSVIRDGSRPWMNERGVAVAPGQKPLAYKPESGSLSEGGSFELQDFDLADAPVFQIAWGDFRLPVWQQSHASFWVSGLATFSAKKTYGFIASKWIKAVRSGEPERIQGVLNTDLGELYRVGGDAPEWSAVMDCATDYQMTQVPNDALFLTCGVDVGKRNLVFVVRAWGPGYESWLVDRGELWGETDQPEIWQSLEQLLMSEYGHQMPITRMLVDSGYRAENVYEFCRSHPGLASPSKGHDTLSKPYYANQIDVNVKGKVHKKGLQLWHFDSDVMKSWVHGRINRSSEHAGGWYLPMDIDPDYCKQIVAESRVEMASGKARWFREGANHFLDAEALAYLAARISGKVPPPGAIVPQQRQKGRRVRSKGVSV